MSEINILTVIDTNYVKKTFAGSYSTDPTRPTAMHGIGDYCYIFVDGTTVNSGQGTINVNFNAKPGDDVSFRGTSIYGNSEDAVIIYNVTHCANDGGGAVFNHAFNRFVPDVITRSKAAVPDPSAKNGLPVLHQPVNFTSLDSKVKAAGTACFLIFFAIYQLASDGQSQDLVTYIQIDPVITVA